MMKRSFIALTMMLMTLTTMAQDNNEQPKFDPNFHIYLCFGQSNMQGKGKIEEVDKTDVPERFKMMATVDFPSMSRKAGEWYTAVPPLCRPETGLCPADYFGREMVKNLPDSITVGVINTAVDGCSIVMFDEDACKNYIVGQPDYMTSAAKAYDNNPFRRLVDLAKEAQKVGVIKGILMHQGETDMDNLSWGTNVHRVYHRILNELGLRSTEVPLIAGEALRQEYGGVCYKQITQVKKLPNVIPNMMIASSEGCKNMDQYHFNSAGYRIIGRRYGQLMLKYLEGYKTAFEEEMTSLRIEGEKIEMTPSNLKKLNVIGTDAEGKEYNVTSACNYEIADPELLSIEQTTLVSAQKPGTTTVTATMVNKSGTEVKISFEVEVTLFGRTTATFQPSIYNDGTLSSTPSSDFTFKGKTGGIGGWIFENFMDVTETPFLMLDFAQKPSTNNKLCIFDKNDFGGTKALYAISTGKQHVIDLRTLKVGKEVLDISHIYMLGFCFGSTPSLYINSVKLSADGETPVKNITLSNNEQNQQTLYDLQGRKTAEPAKGIYLSKGKKVVK